MSDVAELRRLLHKAAELIIWMSGSEDFGPDGWAGEEWARRRDTDLKEILDALEAS